LVIILGANIGTFDKELIKYFSNRIFSILGHYKGKRFDH